MKIVLIFLLIVIGCEEIKVDVSGFKNIKKIVDSDFQLTDILEHKDTIPLLLCKDLQKFKNYLVTCSQDDKNPIKIFNLKNNSIVFSGGNIGRGPDEQLIFQNLSGHEDSTFFWISDMALLRMNKYSFNTLLVKNENRPDKQVTFEPKNNEMPYNIVYQKELFFAPDLNGSGRIVSYNEKGLFINFFGIIPKSSNIKFNDYKQAYAYQGKLEAKIFENEKALFVKINQFSSLVEVYDGTGSEKFTLFVPEAFTSPYESVPTGVIFEKETLRYGSMDADITNKSLYIAYSGLNPIENENAENHFTIFVYDLEGNPLRKLNFKDGFTCFDVSNDDESLYAFSETKGIMIFDMRPYN